MAIWHEETKPQRWQRAARVAAQGGVPEGFAHHFRRREASAMRIIQNEIFQRGACDLCLDAIADRAAVSRSTVKRAIVAALALGWLTREVRERKGQNHLTSVLRPTLKGEAEWLIKRGRGSGPDRPFLKTQIPTLTSAVMAVKSGNSGDNLPRLGVRLRSEEGLSRAESG